MARTVRAKRKSGAIVRDGVFQYAAGGCRHHGSCGYCVQNRTFSRADSEWDKDLRDYGWPDADPYYMMMES